MWCGNKRNLFLTSDSSLFFSLSMVVCISYCARHWKASAIRYQCVTGYEKWTEKLAATAHQDLHPEGLKTKPRRMLYLDDRFLAMSDAGTWKCINKCNGCRFSSDEGIAVTYRVKTFVHQFRAWMALSRATDTLTVFAKNTPVFVPCFLTRTWYGTPTVTTYSVRTLTYINCINGVERNAQRDLL
jgi:hypothetical protein